MVQPLRAQKAAIGAAREVGVMLRKHLHAAKRANVTTAHDIKLELDVRAQGLIERRLGRSWRGVAFMGEEERVAEAGAAWRGVVDPIDGTVNFAYGIPHACVSIALQRGGGKGGRGVYDDGYQTVVG